MLEVEVDSHEVSAGSSAESGFLPIVWKAATSINRGSDTRKGDTSAQVGVEYARIGRACKLPWNEITQILLSR